MPDDVPSDRRPSAVAVPPPSEQAVRYHRSGTVIWAVEQVLALAIPSALLFTGLSAWLRTLAARLAANHFYPTLLIDFALLSLVLSVVQLPLSYYVGYARERAYGLSEQRLGKWAGDQVKGFAVGLVVAAAVLWVPYRLLAVSPAHWWLWTGALALPFFVLILLITPVFIAPLFNKFGPMRDQALEAAVLAVAAQAGVSGARVFEVEKSVDTKKVNAYVTGVGKTKRIVLWDTLVARLTPDQTRFVVGHELGHYVLHHVWLNILTSTALTIAALYGVHRTADLLLVRFGDRFGFTHVADVASMPLFMLLFSLFGVLITPALLALSRHHERAADAFGLDLTGDKQAAASAFVALQQQNLAVPRPGRFYKLFRASHPPIGERVDFINAYQPRSRP